MSPAFPPLTAAQRRLAEHALSLHSGLVCTAIRKSPSMADELTSAAGLGAVHAAGTWDRGRGKTFASWSKYKITMAMREAFDARPMIGLRRLSCTGTIPAEADHEQAVDSRDAFDALLKNLHTKSGASLMRLVYIDGYKPAEAGRVLGLSKSRGCIIHGESLGRLDHVMKGATA